MEKIYIWIRIDSRIILDRGFALEIESALAGRLAFGRARSDISFPNLCYCTTQGYPVFESFKDNRRKRMACGTYEKPQ